MFPLILAFLNRDYNKGLQPLLSIPSLGFRAMKPNEDPAKKPVPCGAPQLNNA